MPIRIRRPQVLILIFSMLVLLLSLPAAAGDQITRDFTFEAESLLVADMIGAVTVVPAPGDRFTVTVRVGGQDAQEGRLEFVTRKGNDSSLAIKFPTQDHQDYVYPPLGPGSKSTISYNEKQGEDGSWVKKVLGEIAGRRITVRGQGKGLALWADVTVAVPRGRSLTVELGVGEVRATGLQADLDLDVDSGPVQARDIQGDVRIDTGSGGGEADKVRGSLTIDTGSGGVEVSVDRMGEGKFTIDTGSGDIELEIPREASARITAETGSGRVSQDLQGVEVNLLDRHEMDLTVGGGQARVALDAGSGSITVTRK